MLAEICDAKSAGHSMPSYCVGKRRRHDSDFDIKEWEEKNSIIEELVEKYHGLGYPKEEDIVWVFENKPKRSLRTIKELLDEATEEIQESLKESYFDRIKDKFYRVLSFFGLYDYNKRQKERLELAITKCNLNIDKIVRHEEEFAEKITQNRYLCVYYANTIRNAQESLCKAYEKKAQLEADKPQKKEEINEIDQDIQDLKDDIQRLGDKLISYNSHVESAQTRLDRYKGLRNVIESRKREFTREYLKFS